MVFGNFCVSLSSRRSQLKQPLMLRPFLAYWLLLLSFLLFCGGIAPTVDDIPTDACSSAPTLVEKGALLLQTDQATTIASQRHGAFSGSKLLFHGLHSAPMSTFQTQRERERLSAKPPPASALPVGKAAVTPAATPEVKPKESPAEKAAPSTSTPLGATAKPKAQAPGWIRTHKVVVIAFSAAMLVVASLFFFSKPSPHVSDVPETGTVSAALAQFHPETTGLNDDGDDIVVTDTMTYRTEGLCTMTVFTSYPCTVWDNETLWLMMRRTLGLSVFIAVAELVLVPNPESLDPSRFASVGTMLNVFIGLLLTFFLSSSCAKWYSCVNGFLMLFDSVRKLQMQFHALGVRRDRADVCIRYGVVSAWALNYELRRFWSPKEEQDQMKRDMWDELCSRDDYLSRVLPEEREQLELIDDASGLIWTWVGSIVGRMAQDGDIPPMASPTYGRVVDLAQRAQDGLRQVRSAISVQLPFVYVHTLATIVQLNNILAAVSFGLTLGATMGTAVVRINNRLSPAVSVTSPTRPFMEDVQDVVTQLFKCFVVPVLYQAFFEIGVAISSPLSSEDAAIPTERMLMQLQKDLHSANILADNPPSWEPPCFSQPSAPE